MGAPQILWLGLYSLGLSLAIIRWGEPIPGEYGDVSHLAAAALNITLLWWGGFFGG